jgi:rifampicin phosphotransferase
MQVSPPAGFDPADAWRAPYAATTYDLWTRTNVGEVWPHTVTPLSYSVMVALGDAVFTQQPERMKLLPKELFRDGVPPSAFRAINGHMFYNTGLIHYIFTDRFGFPSWFWMLSLGGPQDAAGEHLVLQPFRPLRVLRSLPAALRESRRQQRAVADFERDQAAMRRQAAALRREDLGALSESALVERLERVAKLSEAPEAQLFDGSQAALNAYGMLAGLCERWCGGRALANDLVTGLATMETANATVALWQVARLASDSAAARAVILADPPATLQARLRAEPDAAPVADALDRFFEDFGHRCVDEFELAAARWSEEPSFIVTTLRTYLAAPAEADPVAHLARQRRRRRAATREARDRMLSSGLHRVVPYRWVVFRALLRDARRLLPMRENPKHHFLLFVAEIRRTIMELAGRLTARGILADIDDVFLLTREELAAAAESAERGAPAPGVQAIVQARRELYLRFRAWSPPDVIPGGDVDRIERDVLASVARGDVAAVAGTATQGDVTTEAAETGTPARVSPTASGELRGIAASGGVVTARARVALTPDEGAEIEPGEVLVAPFTDPGWTPLFTVAGAVVMDLGGLLSHGAIVAREYGIPAVVNTREATATIRTGQLITVDGSTGVVRWEAESGAAGEARSGD